MTQRDRDIHGPYVFRVAVVELVDTADLKSAGLYCEGSSPFGGTIGELRRLSSNRAVYMATLSLQPTFIFSQFLQLL